MKLEEWLEWMGPHWERNGADPEKHERICKFGMAEEMGEVLGHFKRMERGDPKPDIELIEELGDVLHYIHRYMQLRGIDPEYVFGVNRDKLVVRYHRGHA